MFDIILNLKQIRFKSLTGNMKALKLSDGYFKDQEVFKAGDINKYLSVFQVSTTLVICHMEPSVKLTIDLTIDKGRGYVPAEENKTPMHPLVP
jgi:DNA-directed RNA polymerase subunit alpha